MSKTIIIIGAGLAGLSAALQAAENGCNVKLVSSLSSERAQSVMAEGGINAALNTKDENDSPEEHFTDTIKAACGLADPNAVWGMTQAAPELVHWLLKLGVKFNMSGYDDVDLRNFGGQKKKRTAFAQSDTGKQIMTAMIDAVRRKEASGMVERFSHHSFLTLRLCGNICCGCVIRDEYSQETVEFPGDAVIVATGGMHGLFGNTSDSWLTFHISLAVISRGIRFPSSGYFSSMKYHCFPSFMANNLPPSPLAASLMSMRFPPHFTVVG